MINLHSVAHLTTILVKLKGWHSCNILFFCSFLRKIMKDSCNIMLFVPCQRKYSQSYYRKAAVYLMVLHSALISIKHHTCCNDCVGHSVFSIAWYKIDMQYSLVAYPGISHLLLSFLGMQTSLLVCVHT